MKLLISAAIFFSIFHSLKLPTKLADWAKESQKVCNEMMPTDTFEYATLASLVCGEKVTEIKKRNLLRESGLIHIFVVSGGHLILLCEFCNWIRLPFGLQNILLLLFSLMTGCQPPCVRSLVQLHVRRFIFEKKLFYTKDQEVFISGLVTLLLFPEWKDSLSFHLSWMAGLSLAASSETVSFWKSPVTKALFRNFLIYGMILPLTLHWGGVSPLSILWNFLLAPLIAGLLFPMSALAAVGDPFLYILEKIMPLFWLTLENLPSPPFEVNLHLPLLTPWVIVITFHIATHWKLVHLRRKHRT